MNTPENTGQQSTFANPAFRHYLLASVLITMAVWMVRFLLGWQAWALTHSAFWVGLVSAAQLVPTLILSPIFGVVSDKINPARGLTLTSFINGVIALLTGIALYFDWQSPPFLLAVAFTFGCATAAQAPMRLATLPRLVSRRQMASAVGYSAVVFNTSRILGPLLAAGLLTLVTEYGVYLAATLLFLLTSTILRRLTIRPLASLPEPSGLWRSMQSGLRHIAQHPIIQLLLGLSALNGILGRTYMELLPAISGLLTAGRASDLAILTACAGVGSVLGGFLISHQRAHIRSMTYWILAGLLVSQLLLLLLSWLPGILSLGAMTLVCSLAMTIVGTATQAMLQMGLDDHIRGRIMSVWTVLVMCTPALGAFVGGALTDIFGLANTLAMFALLCLLVTAILYRRIMQIPAQIQNG